MKYGGDLLALRLAKDLSQRTLAGEIGMSDAWLSEVEQGKVDVPLSRLLALAEELNAEIVIIPRAADPEFAVQRALESDTALDPSTREVVLAAYRAARIARAGKQPQRKRHLASRSLRVGELRTIGSRSRDSSLRGA